jgi:hypothetical protein
VSDVLTLIGIDPGIVHTGFVVMQFTPGLEVKVSPIVFEGDERDKVVKAANDYPDAYIFIEGYRPRGNIYAQDTKMADLVAELDKRIRRAKVVDNTGVKGVVGQKLMELFGVWRFTLPTHHQDLRSAARIAIYGALKDEDLNEILFDYAFERL